MLDTGPGAGEVPAPAPFHSLTSHRFHDLQQTRDLPAAQRRLAEQLALPLRVQLVAEMADVFRHLHATVTTP